nr:zinc finger protein RFP-like [Pogona vitticeps]
MAAGGFLQEFCQETTCNICLEPFNEPVTIDCGHNFCQACLTKVSGKSSAGVSCPECGEPVPQRNFKPNRQLANIVQLVKKLRVSETVERTRGVCQKHQEPLKFFCKDDNAAICVVCDRSKEHRQHIVLPIEEVSQEYKEEIIIYMKFLKKQKEALESHKASEELQRQEYWKLLALKEEKVNFAFDSMQMLLEEKRQCWLANLQEIKKEMEKKAEENIVGISEDVFRLSQHMAEMEKLMTEIEASQSPANELLEETRQALNRYEKNLVTFKVDLSANLEERIRFSFLKTSELQKAVDDYKEYLEKTLNPCKLPEAVKPENLKPTANKVSITLDQDTAHPYLVLSEDLKMVTWESKKKRREWKKRSMPNNPERFDWETCVLGCEKFTSGINWWVVEVSGVGSWAVGVVRDSVKRKGSLQFHPEEGFWALRKSFQDTHSSREIVALTSPDPTPLMVKAEPIRIIIILDYEGGQVDFLDADTSNLIFTFQAGSFSGETIRPFLQVREWGFSLKC